MTPYINAIRSEAMNAIASVATTAELDETYRRYCGRNGIVTLMKKAVGEMMAEERGKVVSAT